MRGTVQGVVNTGTSGQRRVLVVVVVAGEVVAGHVASATSWFDV